jgi:hypothetical protein
LPEKHLSDKNLKLSVIDKLAISLGRKDNIPNQELAKEIAKTNDRVAVSELIEIIASILSIKPTFRTAL